LIDDDEYKSIGRKFWNLLCIPIIRPKTAKGEGFNIGPKDHIGDRLRAIQ
jgi:hypothetical protein